jgi:hypothetical protein
VAWIIHLSIFCLNQFVVWIAKLPFSTLEQIYIPAPSLFLLLGFLIFLQFWILNTRYKMLIFSLWFMLAFSVSILCYQTYLWKRPKQTYVIRTKKDWMLSTIQGRKASLTLLASDTIKAQNSFEIKSLKEGFHLMDVASFCQKGKVVSPNKKSVLKQSTLVLEKGKRFLFLGNYLKMDTMVQSKLKVDYLIVQQIGLKTLDNALAGLAPKEIWVDWPGQKVEAWKSQNPNMKMLNFRSNRFQSLELD